MLTKIITVLEKVLRWSSGWRMRLPIISSRVRFRSWTKCLYDIQLFILELSLTSLNNFLLIRIQKRQPWYFLIIYLKLVLVFFYH